MHAITAGQSGELQLKEVAALWSHNGHASSNGLIYLRRKVIEGKESPSLLGLDVEGLAEEYEHRCRAARATSAGAKQRVRDEVLRDAGGVNYDRINNEFRRVAKRLSWPRTATLKDFRHLFATSLADGGMLEHERRYLMGHAPGHEALQVYTHMDRLSDHYRTIMQAECSAVLDIIRRRAM